MAFSSTERAGKASLMGRWMAPMTCKLKEQIRLLTKAMKSTIFTSQAFKPTLLAHEFRRFLPPRLFNDSTPQANM